MICASEQSVIVADKIYDKVKKEIAYRGCYFLKGKELDKVRKTIIINGALNAKIVGQSAYRIAQLAGVEVPESTKVLIGEVESVDISEEFAHEKLSPVLAMYRASSFEDALGKAERLIADGGYGHTSSIYLNEHEAKDRFAEFCERMKTCRVLLNSTPSSFGGIGDLYNFKLAPSLTLGCGTWGGNLRFRERRREASAQHQIGCRKERKHAVVQGTSESLCKEGLSARRRSTSSRP